MIDVTAPFNVATHNGIITMRNPATGEHRTVKISTSRDNSTRWVSLLTGSDNERDYKTFGRIDRVGRAVVFQKLRSPGGKGFYEGLANILNQPERFAERLEFMFEARCRRCGRLLTTPRSLEIGIGPECEKRER